MAAPVVIGRTPTLEHRGAHQLPRDALPVRNASTGGSSNGTNTNALPKLDLSSTPNGKHLISTTPGGSRIVYSLEELLSLASSPLSHMSAIDVPVPDEISRSPEKRSAAAFGNDSSAAADTPSVTQANQASYTAHTTSPPVSKAAAAATTPRSFRRPSVSQRLPGASNALSTSPTASRSPGNAFDFSRGPIGGAGINGTSHSHAPSNAALASPPALESTPAEFKERLAAASAAAREQQRSLASAVTSNTASAGNGNSKESDVQFDMDI